MNEFEVDRILAEIGQEEFMPSAELLARTRRKIHRNPWLPVLVGAGIGLQLLTIGGAQVYLLYAGVSALLQVLGQVGLAAAAGVLAVLTAAARRRVQGFLCRLEAAAGCR